MVEQIKLSLIVPCYNAETILKNNIEKIKDVLDKERFNYDIILIDDKSKDKTVEIAKQIAAKNKNMRMISHENNVGRGGTVSEGIKISKSDVVGFIDIDLEIPATYIPNLVRQINDGYDIAAARRDYKLTFDPKSLIRFIIGKGYSFLVRFVLDINLRDTETGCKFFNRRHIIPVLEQVANDGWFWDTEIMVRSYLAGLNIKEVPAVFIRKPGFKSSVHIVSDSLYYFEKLMNFRKVVNEIRRSKRPALRVS